MAVTTTSLSGSTANTENKVNLDNASSNTSIFELLNLGYCYFTGSEAGVRQDYKRAAEIFKIGADQGHAVAIHNLGVCYLYGHGVEKNQKLAAELFQRAVNLGDTDAAEALGQCYEYGHGVTRDLKRAAEIYEKLGNAAALFRLAANFEEAAVTKWVEERFKVNGSYDAVEQDKKRAAALYQLAANLGHTGALNNLGHCYSRGDGVERDQNRAVALWHQAANLGHTEALNILADCYSRGDGVEKDQKRALELYQQAANLGDGNAMAILGDCYYFGRGVPEDLERGAELYQFAASLGCRAAVGKLANCYTIGNGVPQDYHRVILLYQFLKECYQTEYERKKVDDDLEDYYRCTNTTPRELKLAIEHYTKAADEGDPIALSTLGFAYQTGLGVEQDIEHASSLFVKAINKGASNCLINLWHCYKQAPSSVNIDQLSKNCQEWASTDINVEDKLKAWALIKNKMHALSLLAKIHEYNSEYMKAMECYKQFDLTDNVNIKNKVNALYSIVVLAEDLAGIEPWFPIGICASVAGHAFESFPSDEILQRGQSVCQKETKRQQELIQNYQDAEKKLLMQYKSQSQHRSQSQSQAQRSYPDLATVTGTQEVAQSMTPSYSATTATMTVTVAATVTMTPATIASQTNSSFRTG